MTAPSSAHDHPDRVKTRREFNASVLGYVTQYGSPELRAMLREAVEDDDRGGPADLIKARDGKLTAENAEKVGEVLIKHYQQGKLSPGLKQEF